MQKCFLYNFRNNLVAPPFSGWVRVPHPVSFFFGLRSMSCVPVSLDFLFCMGSLVFSDVDIARDMIC